MYATKSHLQNHFCVADTPVQFDHAGALWLPRERALVFSDLHFEKGSSYGRKGLFLPPYDTRRTLKNMTEVISRWQPRMIVSLGDAFHDGDAEARMDADDMVQLKEMTTRAEWIWILGNHDPMPPMSLGGRSCESILVDGLHFSHEPLGDADWQVAGHMHPAAKISRGGRTLRRRCFMTDGTRLIMPSFGAYTGGLNVLDEAYQHYFDSTFSVHLLGEERVWQVRTAELKSDR